METNIKDFICPVCGSSDFEVIHENEDVKVPYGEDKELELIKVKCNECETVTDYSKLYTHDYTNALDDSKKQSIENMLNNLSNIGYSLAAIERALELPQRTISRWKNTQEISAIGLSLLRIINTYPWVLQVAQNKFEPTFARSIFIHNAVNELFTIYNSSGNLFAANIGVFSNLRNLFIIAKYEFKVGDNYINAENEVIHNPLQANSNSPHTFTEVIK